MTTEHIEAFNSKIIEEAPDKIETCIGDVDVRFVLRDSFFDQDSLLEYDVELPNEEHVLQIQYWYSVNNPNHHRIEVRTPNLRAYQITCFHCNTVGLLEPERIVEIEQIVKVSGQSSRDGLDVRQTNERIKEEACLFLDQEGLLVEPNNRAARWRIGTYDSQTRAWLYGQTTAGFIKNFLKVALIMAYCRGNRGINLYPNAEDPSQSVDDEDTLTSISAEAFKEKREKWEVTGLKGEEFVVEIERRRLIEVGRVDLADAVRHVSLFDCGAGYDILSYELDGRSRFIECKTSAGSSMKFEITSNEWNKAKKYREQYYLYRITNIDQEDHRDIVIIQDPFGKFEDGELTLTPSAFTLSII
ncbi:DUF3883 domain-containing protein [Paenibacillus barcinonensis]|uniref:DUF3883 domain-containing protein n=1 Tax=Paenibacillus barcinonensis TaxID=198119 RepID=A0A2V4WBF2_PAEBA|nr:DUF3883 domain-containing protein [Paenibacillus barcinonensis]PYE48777.1 uncharacterized protein DUF3883 [Paenibacillus barcinonensis]QKS57795.1 DUF3883 domain-containing protein [Paenibacillus barcinonensis]